MAQLDFIQSRYGQDLKSLVVYLFSKPTHVSFPTIEDVIPMLSGRLLQQVEHLQNYDDFLENELSKEIENGRMFRILCKLGMKKVVE